MALSLVALGLPAPQGEQGWTAGRSRVALVRSLELLSLPCSMRSADAPSGTCAANIGWARVARRRTSPHVEVGLDCAIGPFAGEDAPLNRPQRPQFELLRFFFGERNL